MNSLDIFGQSFNLNYKGQTAYKSWIGGLFGIILSLIMIWFSYDQIFALYYKVSPQNSITYSYLDVFQMSPIQANDIDFIFAFRIDMINKETNEISDALKTIEGKYFNVSARSINHNALTQQNTNQQMSYVKCSLLPTREKSMAFANIKERYKSFVDNTTNCIINDGLTFSGNAAFGTGLQFQISQCNPQLYRQPCATMDELSDLMTKYRLQVQVYGISSYLDFNNYTHPIQSDLILLNSPDKPISFTEQQRMTVVVQEAKASVTDNLFQFSNNHKNIDYRFSQTQEKDKSFIEINGPFVTAYDNQTFTSSNYMDVRLIFDNKVILFSRQVEGVFQCIANISGVFLFFFIIFKQLLMRIESKIFDYQLLMKDSKYKERLSSDLQKKFTNMPDKLNFDQLQQVANTTKPYTLRRTPGNWFCYVFMPDSCYRLFAGKKFVKYMDLSNKRRQNSLDIVQIIQNFAKVKVLEKMVFTKFQRTMLKHHKDYWLVSDPDPEKEVNEKDADDYLSDAMLLELSKKFKQGNHDLNTKVDQKIWKGIFILPRGTQLNKQRLQVSQLQTCDNRTNATITASHSRKTASNLTSVRMIVDDENSQTELQNRNQYYQDEISDCDSGRQEPAQLTVNQLQETILKDDLPLKFSDYFQPKNSSKRKQNEENFQQFMDQRRLEFSRNKLEDQTADFDQI